MRTHKIDDMKIEYPDEISFCFNPVVINISGHTWECIAVTVTDVLSDIPHIEKRVMFRDSCFFDVSFYMQSAFDAINFNRIDYSVSGAQDSKMGRLFSVELDFYTNDGALGNSFQFNTFVIWGAMQIGERYNGDRTLTWFKNYPFTVGMYAPSKGHINVTSDGAILPAIEVLERNAYNLMLKGIDAQFEVVFTLPSSTGNVSVFDKTFDFTFRGLLNTSTSVRLIVDDSDDGVYLRWINRHGFYCYWLFNNGDESRQVVNDGEFIRNNMQDYNYINGYHGGTGRKQKKSENRLLPVCATLIDSDTYDYLFQIALSPVVDMYFGTDENGMSRWAAVNISVETYIKSRSVLQDFMATIILPETSVQSL